MTPDEYDTTEIRRRLEAYLERSRALLAEQQARRERRKERLRRLTFGVLGRYSGSASE